MAKRLVSGALALAVAAGSVNWSFFADEAQVVAEAADVTYKYFEINFDDASQLNGDPFYLHRPTESPGFSVQNGALVKNGQNTIFGLNMYEKYGDEGKLTMQFDLRSERGGSRNAPWNTTYVGLRLPNDQNVPYMQGGIWLSFKDNTIGVRFNQWALTSELTVPINISDRRHKIYIEDDQDANRINIWVDDVHSATFVIKEPSTIEVYDASGALRETLEVAHEIGKGGYVSWWCHDLETAELDNVKVWMPNISEEAYVPVDESKIQDTYMDTWVAVDDLGRLTPTNDEVGDIDEEKMVGMFYFLTHDGYSAGATDHYTAYLNGGVQGVWNVLAQPGEHFWGRPYFGYYNSEDEWVIRKHATMMVEAGIDFIFFDCSNNILYTSTTNKILETYREMREEGLQTPKIMWFLNDREDFTANSLHRVYDEVYKNGKYSDLWMMWEGKPLIMVNPNNADPSVPMDFFTVRRSWAFESYGPYQQAGGRGFWQWADVYPQAPGYSPSGELEQMVVMSGFWANGNGGRSNTQKYPYHSTAKFDYPRILGNNFEMHRVEQGISAKGAGYQEQFDYALEVDPPVLLLVGWNEWKAGSQGLGAGLGQDIANTYVVDGQEPHHQFTDCFNPEFARDIEPMTGGYTDAFYYQTVINVREFEGVREIPTNNDNTTINIDGDFSQWNNVHTAYYDTPNDTYHRNMMAAYIEGRYINTTGRNDLRTAKVAYDNDYTYFYIDASTAITSAEGENWMNLFIDADNNSATGWKGYDLILNRSRDGSNVSVEKSINNSWNWQNIGSARYKLSGNQMMIALPNSLSGLGNIATFDFKWADNSTTNGTAEQFMDLGDAAPDQRFNFRVVRNKYSLSDEAFSHLGSFTVNMAVGSSQAFLGYQKSVVNAPFTENGVVYVPLETVAFNQDVDYSFNGSTATIHKIEDILTIDVGSNIITTNQGNQGTFTTSMPGTAKSVGGTMYIPLESAAFALERNYYTNGDLIQIGGAGISRANANAAKEIITVLGGNSETVGDDGIYTSFTSVDSAAKDNWIYREVNNADTYANRFSSDGLMFNWDDTALRGIISKVVYEDYTMTAKIKKATGSAWTSLQLGLPLDERLDMWENIIGGSLIGGTGLQVAISDTKATVGLINGIENTDTTQVEVALNGINTTSQYVDLKVTLVDNVYNIYIGSQHIATVTLDKNSIQYGGMELRRETIDGVLTYVYADSDVAYYTAGTITANGTDTYFSGKAVAVANAETGDGTFGFSTRAEKFWLKDVQIAEYKESTGSDDSGSTTTVNENLANNWLYREANDVNTYLDRINGSIVYLDWDDPALRAIVSKKVYSNFKLTAQIKKETTSPWTAIHLGLPYDERLDTWENVTNTGNLIGGTGLQIAISDTKAIVGLVNGCENTDITQVEVPLTGAYPTSGYVDVEITAKDNVYDITIGSQHIATVTFDESSITYGAMELRRASVNGVMTPVYADNDVEYYTSGKITANGTDTYFTNKAVAVIDPSTGDGTVAFSTRAQGFWVNNPVVTEIEGGTTTDPDPVVEGNSTAGLDGTYYIQNVYSGKYLEVAGSNTDDGANVQQWGYSGAANQQFKLVSDGNGYYEIRTGATGFEKAVDVDAWGTEKGTNIHQWSYNGLDCQKFEIIKTGDYITIATKLTNGTMLLDVEGPSMEDGANVHQWEKLNQSSQQWVLVAVTSSGDDQTVEKNTLFTGENAGNGWDQVVSIDTTRAGGSVDPSMITADGYFYVEYSGTQGELELIVQSWSGGANWGKVKVSETGSVNGRYYAKFAYADCVAQFGSDNFAGLLDRIHVGALHESLTVYELSYVTVTTVVEPEPEPSDKGNSVPGLEGTYYIRNVNSGKYMDIAGGSAENGGNIQQYTLNGSNAQKFKLVDDGNGYYIIYTGATDYTKVVEVADGSAEDGANVQQWEFNGADCQRFEIVEHNGYLVFKTKVSGSTRAVDVDGWGMDDLVNIIQWEFHGGTCQLWVLEDVNSVSPGSGNPNAVVVRTDLNVVSDPPLVKKIEMYNAGCIEPLNDQYNRDFSKIRELNSTELRIDASINKWEGTAGKYLVGEPNGDANQGNWVNKDLLVYDFSRLDPIIDTLRNNGVVPYIAWCYVPDVLSEGGAWNNLDTSISNWKEIWEEMHYQYAKHYVDSGIQIGYHEIYNEPDLEALLGAGNGFLNLTDYLNGVYLDIYEYGAKGVLRADPDATIGGPSYADANPGNISSFLSRVTSVGLPLDFFSYHSYLDGNTWFMSEGERASGAQNEQERVVSYLAGDRYFIKTDVHINEYTYLNSGNGGNNDRNSPFNYYGAASDTLDAIMEAVDRTTVTKVYWAQFMESTFYDDPYGIIDKYGNIKAAFNAVKMYNDMPTWRYAVNVTNSNGVRSIVSADEDKISVLMWNTNGANSDVVDVFVNNADFASGTRRIYRIDGSHGSHYNNAATAALTAEDVAQVSTSGCIWTGSIPANGVVYVTVNRDGKEDFVSYNERTSFADYVKIQNYYEDRYRGLSGARDNYYDYASGISGSYSFFDRATNTMYLGMGDSAGLNGNYVGQAHASSAILVKNIPTQFTVNLKTEGGVAMRDTNSTLGFRVDFYDNNSGSYVKSVYFHNGIYDNNRNPIAQDGCLSGLPEYPWGTQRKAEQVVQMTGDTWNIDLSQYAPAGWNSSTKVQISFDMQNTGANTRASFTLSK